MKARGASTVVVCAALALASLAAHAQLSGPTTLNDTGMARCSDGNVLTTECGGTGQDGATGRDVLFPSDADGHAGFRYVKLGADGLPLPRGARAWRCVGDVVTGLVWEMKTAGAGPSATGNVYTNYGDGRKGDTGSLAANLDAHGVCGATNWRLPTFDELRGLVDYGVGSGPQIDTAWFPNTGTGSYWSSTGYARDARAAWTIRFDGANSVDGTSLRNVQLSARLVHDTSRSAPHADAGTRYTFASDEVTDTWTNLVWKRCIAGLVFTDSICLGNGPTAAGWFEALAAAKAEAAATGLGWRLPNIKELSSIMDRTTSYPAVDTTVFPNDFLNGGLFTSTPSAYRPYYAVSIQMCCGTLQDYPIASNWQLNWRLVRDR